MPISIRLDPFTEARLQRLVRRTGRTKSAVIREAIERLDEAVQEEESAAVLAEQLRPFIGVVDLGPSARGRNAEAILRERFRRVRPDE